jgi:tripartite-type tricarboxylate transporter receptor subunit TctC
MRLAVAVAMTLMAAVSLPCPPANAEFPAKRPITIIIGVPAGGGADTIARLIGPKLTEAFGQPIIVEPRPGGNFLNSVRPATGAPPDGHTLLMATSGYSMIAAKPNPPFDLVADFTPVSLVARGHAILVASPKLPVNNLPELIRYAKANPGKLSFGSGGTGTLFHLAGEFFKTVTKIDTFHVPYKGSVPALQDVMGGHIDYVFDNLGPLITHVRAGAVKALAVTTPQRSPALPDVPTFAELGYPEFNVSQWYGLVAPPAMPPDIVDRIRSEVSRALASPEVVAQLNTLGTEAVGSSPGEFKQVLEAEVARWSRVIKDSGIDLQ